MNRLRQLREEQGISMKEAARRLDLPYTTYVNYEKGYREPNSETLIDIADFYNVSVDFLIGKSTMRINEDSLDRANAIDAFVLSITGNLRDGARVQRMIDSGDSDAAAQYVSRRTGGVPSNILPMPETKKLPRLGTIACGEPILAEENIEDWDSVPLWVRADFTLKCKGDSMINARIFDGDVVCIHKQEAVDDGEIAAVLIGDEATLKRVHLFADHIVLQPENPNYRPLSYWEEEMNDVHILGKATYFISAVR